MAKIETNENSAVEAESSELLTLGQIADILGVQLWRMTRLVGSGFTPPPVRVGRMRCFRRDQLGVLRAAVERARIVTMSKKAPATV